MAAPIAAGGALASPTLPIPATGALAAPTTLPIPTTGAVLVSMTDGLFMPPRMLVVPAGTRLPHGVHAVAKVAVAGPDCRGAMHWALAAPAGDAGDDDDDDKLQQDDDAFYREVEAYGVEALELLSGIEPPARLIGKANLIKDDLEKALKKTKALEDTYECVQALLHGIYSIVELVEECGRKE